MFFASSNLASSVQYALPLLSMLWYCKYEYGNKESTRLAVASTTDTYPDLGWIDPIDGCRAYITHHR